MTSIPRADEPDEPSLIDEPSVVYALRVTLVIFFASALVISAVTLFLRWRLTPQLALVAGASSLVALALSRSGRIRPAMMLPLLFITCAVLTLAARSDGIQNIGLAILPVLILVGSLVLDRLTLVFFTASIILAVVGMLAIRYFVLLAERYSMNDIGDLLIFAITCATAALVGRMFALRIKDGLRRAQSYCRALGEAERNVRLVADSLREMVVAYDMHRSLIYANSGAEKMSGYGIEELQVAAPLSWAHPDDRPKVLELWDKVFDGQTVDQIVHRIITKDGIVRWADGSWGPLVDETGHQIGIRGTCHDITERMVAEQLLEETTQKFRTIVEEITERKRAEAALRESEERLRFAQKVANIGTFDWNIETGVNTWTQELEAMYGLPPGGFERTQPAWEELVHPDDRARAVQRMRESFETNTPVEEEWRVTRPDGSVRWIAGRWQVVKDDSGKPLRVMGVNIDVTDRKQIEEALRRSEERFRLAIRATNDAIWDIDLKTGIVSWNETYSTLYGRPTETSDSWRWWIDRIQPEDRERTVEGLRRAISSGASSWTCEYRFRRADGAWSYIYDRAYIARDAAGAAWRVIGAMQDLTERKSTEQALQESEQRFRAIFSQAAVGIAQTSPDGKFLLVNDRLCEILGYPRSELLGKPFLDLTYPADREALLDMHRRLLAGKISSCLVDKRCIRRDGDIVWSRLFLSVVRDRSGKPQYSIGVVEDITEKIEADRALRETEQRLTLAQSAAHLGVWHRDLGTQIITISGEYTRLYGLEPGRTTLTHEEWLSLIHPDDRERVQALVREARDRTNTFDAEYRVVWPDATIHWILAKGTVFVDDSCRPVRSTGVTMDITDHKRAEATLRESEERLRTSARRLIEAQRLARVGSWERYFEGDAIYWSDEMFRIFGLSIGTPLHFQTFLSYVHPEDREGIVEANQKASTTKAPVIVEYRLTRPDGELRFIRSVVEVIGSDDPNAPIRMAGATQDITEQVKAGEQLRESEERLRSAQRLARFGNWEWDIKTNHIFRSEEICRIFGMPPNSSTTDYKEFLQAVRLQDRDRLVQAARDALAEEKSSWFLEFQITRPDGEVRTVASVAEVFRDAAGSPVRMGGACQDVTDQKCAEAHLRRSLDEIAHLNRVAAMGELTGSLAHELNQPLAAILSNAQAASRFLDREYPDLAQVKECLTDIVADDKRAGEVIRRLRSLLKKGASQPSLVDLNEVVSDAIRLVGNDAMLRNVSVKVEPFPGLAAVLGDRIQLYQLALNLIMNGLDAVAERSPGNRWVLLRTAEADGGGVELRVEDSGKGIAEGDLARVFEPFYTTKAEGLGMGLSISRSIVEAHGGRIWAERSEGRGAIFRCSLPMAQQATAASAN